MYLKYNNNCKKEFEEKYIGAKNEVCERHELGKICT